MSKLKGSRGQGSSPLSEVKLNGKISQFGGPKDPTDSGHTALGLTTATPGIAVYNQSTLGGYWKVTTPNGRTRVIQQTDIGPAPWTGRLIDFTYSAVGLFGYSEGNFPTDATAHAVYLGKNKQAAIEKAGGNAVEAGQQTTSGGEVAPSAGAGKTENVGLVQDAGSLLEVFKDLVTGNIGDLGAKLALASLSIVKDVGVGFADLIIAPAWHWNQRATAYYTGYVLDPKKIGDKSEYQWAFAWTAAFWGVGYVLLWTEPGTKTLKPVPVHRSRIARHVRNAQAIPARRQLVKPKDVQGHTQSKPKPQVSKATVTQRGTMSTTRNRQVRVHDSRPIATTTPEQASGVPIERVSEPSQSFAKKSRRVKHPKPNKIPTGRTGASSNKRVPIARPQAQGRGRRG